VLWQGPKVLATDWATGYVPSAFMEQPEVSRATPADREQVVRTFVAAFVDDPALRFFFPSDPTYPRLASAFAGWLFDKRVRRGTVRVIGGGASVAMWDPPLDVSQTGTSYALNLPPDALKRVAAYDAAVDAILPETPYWYLGVLATHPDHAGQGWGRTVMAEGLRRAARDGVPAYLETSSQRNVEIYQRAGWETVASIPVDALDVRVMRHLGES
jgi:ribosomal protein S18 acetylase RimI-like enzyme